MNILSNIAKYKTICRDFVLTSYYILVCFIPIFTNHAENDFQKYLSTKILSKSFHSLSYKYALIASICASIPLVADLVLDYFSHHQTDRRAVLSRFKIITIILFTDIFIFALVIPMNAGYFFPSLYHGREILIICIVFDFLFESRPDMISRRTSTFITFSYSIGMFLKVYINFLNPQDRITFILNAVAILLQIISTISGFYTFYIALKQFVELNRLKELTQQDRCAVVYLVSTSLQTISVWLIYIFLGIPPWQEIEASYLVAYTYSMLSFSIIVTILNGRINRQEAINTKNMLDKKKMFVRYVSHEIRTPLNIVYLGLQLLKKEMQENDVKCNLSESNCANAVITVTEISESCDTAITILNDLLDYDKLDEGTMKLELSEYDVNELIFSAATPFTVQAREAGITLTLRKPETITGYLSRCKITADKYKINQVVRNLVSNALKFTPQGGRVDLKVSVLRKALSLPSTVGSGRGLVKQISNRISKSKSRSRSRENDHNGWLRITVTDTGAGISLENQSKLFKEIIQFNPGKLQGGHGSGLGLWISRGIIDLHGGRIRVYSEGEGCGSTFIVDIPIKIDVDILDRVVVDSGDINAVPPPIESSIPSSMTTRLHRWSMFITGGDATTPSPPAAPSADDDLTSKRINGSFSTIRRRGSERYFEKSPVMSEITGRLRPSLLPQVHPLADPLFDIPLQAADEGEMKSQHLFSLQTNTLLELTTQSNGAPIPPVHLSGIGVTTGMSLEDSSPSRLSSFPATSTASSKPRPRPPPAVSDRHHQNILSNENSISAVQLSQIDHSSSSEAETLNDIRKRSESSLGLSAHQAATLPGSGQSQRAHNKLRMLVVDDSVMNRKMTCRVMQGSAVYCDQATDGLEAVEIVRRSLEQGASQATGAAAGRQYDVILMDYMMPNMDGPTATKAIRALGFQGQIIGITGNALPCDITTFMTHGANKVLTKPFNINELNSALLENNPA